MKILLLALSMFFVSTSHAKLREGTGDSGGGTGIFCPSSVPHQPAAQLLDFYEGEILNGYTYLESSLPYEKQIEEIYRFVAFDFSLQADFSAALKRVRSNMKFLPEGVSIHVPGDISDGSEAVPLPTGCSLGGIGYYQLNGQLLISTDAFMQLTETQKAAFFVHEAFYAVYRQRREKRFAGPTRRLVAQLFSEQRKLQDAIKLSFPMTWATEGEGVKFTWQPSPGMESKLAHIKSSRVPILFERKNVHLKFSVWGLSKNKFGSGGSISITCHKNSDVTSYKRVELGPVQESASVVFENLPTDCNQVTVNLMKHYDEDRNELRKIQYKFEVDGVEYFFGDGVGAAENPSYGNVFVVQLVPYYRENL